MIATAGGKYRQPRIRDFPEGVVIVINDGKTRVYRL
jgi:hypothetical protein